MENDNDNLVTELESVSTLQKIKKYATYAVAGVAIFGVSYALGRGVGNAITTED